MKASALAIGIVAAIASAQMVNASNVTVPNQFQAGTPAVAAQVNDNFSALQSAVNDNDKRITQLETTLGTGTSTCPDGMTAVGPICVDTYEASIWNGTDSSATQLAVTGGDPSTLCSPDGSNCSSVVARSVPNVLPATDVTWFQAQQACANAGKRLLTNTEWQMAVSGTVASNCNTTSNQVANTGDSAFQNCKSRFGVQDMVGNVGEWVADIVPGSSSTWSPTDGTVFYRGGDNGDAAAAGPLFMSARPPLANSAKVGFRCAK